MTHCRIVLPYAVFGIAARGGMVVEAAPIGAWMIGKTIVFVRAWVIKKCGSMEDLRPRLDE